MRSPYKRQNDGEALILGKPGNCDCPIHSSLHLHNYPGTYFTGAKYEKRARRDFRAHVRCTAPHAFEPAIYSLGGCRHILARPRAHW